jgi:hypothetical protein
MTHTFIVRRCLIYARNEGTLNTTRIIIPSKFITFMYPFCISVGSPNIFYGVPPNIPIFLKKNSGIVSLSRTSVFKSSLAIMKSFDAMQYSFSYKIVQCTFDSGNLLKTGSLFSFRRLKYVTCKFNNEIVMSVTSGDGLRGSSFSRVETFSGFK